MSKGLTIRLLLLALFLFTLLALTPFTGLSLPGFTPAWASGFTTVPVRGFQPLAALTEGVAVFPVGPNRLVIAKPAAQSETTVAVDPTNRKHILVASNDLGDTTQVYESFDSGRTWANAGFDITLFCYDPWLDFNNNGDAFFAYECSDQRIAYRLAGTPNWVKSGPLPAGSFPDRDMVVVDNSAVSPFVNSVYIGYDDAGMSNSAFLMVSRDGQSGWTKSQKINDTNALTIGVNAATGPDGTVYACWLDFNNRRLWVDRSADGGLTWTADDDLVHMYRINTQLFFISIPPQPDRGIVPMCFSDTAPDGAAFAGRVYITYTDRGMDSPDTDIFVRFSDDGGETWSAEALVNDDDVNAYQFHSQITVAPNGTVAISFYDTRDDQPANEKTHRFIAYSTDGGATWSANERITTAQSDESGFGDPNDYGDYQGISVDPLGRFNNIWTDSRIGTNGEDMVYAGSSQP